MNEMDELQYLREENKRLARELIDAKAAAKENWKALMEAELEIKQLKGTDAARQEAGEV